MRGVLCSGFSGSSKLPQSQRRHPEDLKRMASSPTVSWHRSVTDKNINRRPPLSNIFPSSTLSPRYEHMSRSSCNPNAYVSWCLMVETHDACSTIHEAAPTSDPIKSCCLADSGTLSNAAHYAGRQRHLQGSLHRKVLKQCAPAKAHLDSHM